jgi:hypothetical protein
VRFHGFATREDAAAAASVAHGSVARRRKAAAHPIEDLGDVLILNQESTELVVARSGILARLSPPSSENAGSGWGFEIQLLPDEGFEVFAVARARSMWRRLRRSPFKQRMLQFQGGVEHPAGHTEGVGALEITESSPGGLVAESERDDAQYPTNHVVAIFDTSDQTSCALDALLGGGFLESEVDLSRGTEDADRLAQGTGRRGLQDWFIRLTGSVGLKNAETEMKDRYEQALRDNRSVIAVLVPTEERKDLAVGIIRRCGGRFINFFGQLNVERIAG